MAEQRPALVGARFRRWFVVAFPIALGIAITVAVLVAALLNEWVLVSIDGEHARYYHPSLALDDAGNRHILAAFGDENTAPAGICYVELDGREGVERMLDDTRSLSDGSILVDSSGNPQFLYSTYVPGNQVAPTLVYGVIDGETLGFQTVDLSMRYYGLDLAVNSTDVPHIVYADATDIIYAHRVGDVWQEQNLSSQILFTWPLEGDHVFDIALAVDSLDVPHVAAIVGYTLRCCDLLPNDTWRVTTWVATNGMGDTVDIAADSEGNTYVVLEATLPGSYEHAIYLGTLASGGMWTFRPYVGPSDLPGLENSGEIEIEINDVNDMAVCCSIGSPDRMFYQVEDSEGVRNGTLDDSGRDFRAFDMGLGPEGQMYMLARSSSQSLRMLTDSASFGERMMDLQLAPFLLSIAGISVVLAFVKIGQRWRGRKGQAQN